MSIAYDSHSQAFSGSATTISANHTVSGSSPCLVVYVYGNAFTISTITFNGVALTTVDKYTPFTNADIGMYILPNAPTGTHSLSITATGTVTNFGFEANSYTGVVTSSATEAVTRNSSSGATITTSITTTVDKDWHIEGVRAANALTASTNATIRGTPTNSNNLIGDNNAAITPAGSNSVSWTQTSGNYGVIAFGLIAIPIITVNDSLAIAALDTSTIIAVWVINVLDSLTIATLDTIRVVYGWVSQTKSAIGSWINKLKS